MQFFDGDENFSWRVLGVESFVIMLSVLLAFTLNGWRTSQSQQSTVEAALRSIAREMRFNKRNLGQRLPYYQAMTIAFDSLESTIDEELILTRKIAFERIPDSPRPRYTCSPVRFLPSGPGHRSLLKNGL